MKKICWFFVVIGNIVLWFSTSNVAQLVAARQSVLFNRYSSSKFIFNFMIAIFSILLLYIISTEWKKRCKKVLLAIVPLYACLMVVEISFWHFRIASKTIIKYIPHVKREFIFHDKPRPQRTYPKVIPGESVKVRFTIDAQGFRNANKLEQADIVVVGDSFTEGIWVDDEKIWPVLLAKKTGQKVYSLGVSGAHPIHYYHNLKTYGIPLKPHTVVCLLYELNDFHKSRHMKRRSLSKKLKLPKLKKQFGFLLEHCFGGIGSLQTFPQQEIFSWLPVEVSKNKQKYAFYPLACKRILVDKQLFRNSKGWFKTREYLQRIHALCQENNIKLVFAFAPTKFKVIFPAIKDQLPQDELFTRFINIDTPNKKEVNIVQRMSNNLDVVEETVATFCQESQILFHSLTKDMRIQTQKEQLYYSYDVHWNTAGHKVASDSIFEFISK